MSNSATFQSSDEILIVAREAMEFWQEKYRQAVATAVMDTCFNEFVRWRDQWELRYRKVYGRYPDH